jgi:thiol-disulfide isomerase/thioredoxin
MIRDRRTGYVGAIAIILVMCLLHTGKAQTDSVSAITGVQYDLEAGKILYYTSRANLEYTRGTMDTEENLQVWVLEKNPDKSWHLLLRNNAATTRSEGKGKREQLPAKSGWAFCDFYPNGRYTRSWAMDNLALFDLFLPNIFPPLPDKFNEDHITWDSSARMYGESNQYSAGKPDLSERSWVIKEAHKTLLDEVFLMNQKGEIYIDLIKGLPIYKKEENIRGYGYYAGKTNTTTILDSIVDFNSLWAERYAREVGIFLSTDSAYDHILGEAEENPSQIALSRSSAEYLLSQARARATFPEIRAQLEKMITMLPEDFEQITEQIKRHAKLVNKTAPEWKVEDFSGMKHSLDDFRGKVIILDFWYRNCPWCMRSIPLIDRVVDHFKDKPVVVLGVNTDKDRADAIYVIEKMNPSYNNLSGRDLVKKYGVTNYPTFIIIDRNGLVNSIHIGYEPQLAEKLIKIITELL